MKRPWVRPWAMISMPQPMKVHPPIGAGCRPSTTLHALPGDAQPLVQFCRRRPRHLRGVFHTSVSFRKHCGCRPCSHSCRPGQRLVSREGDVWRWDGFTSAADAPSAAAKRLAERNRLALLEVEMQEAVQCFRCGTAEV